jgi:hypothetical protein
MRPAAWACLLVGSLTIVASPAPAQLGELQVGGVGTYGTGEPYGAGAGLVLGVNAGRLAYIGLRWIYQTGTTELLGPASPPTEVTNRIQVFALDLAVHIPVGRIEVVPGLSVGVARFAQRARAPAPGGGSAVIDAHKVEFMAAPGVSVEFPVGPVSLLPELQYSFAGSPSTLPRRVQHRGLLASLRLVITFEVGRIRY